MSQITIHFVSDFPAKLTLNNLPLGTIQKSYDTLSVEVEGEKELFLEVLPLSTNKFFESISYVAELIIFEGNIKTHSNYLEITNYDNCIFEIKVLPIKVSVKRNEEIIQKLNITKDMVATLFDDGNYNIEISTKTKMFRYTLKEKIQNLSCEIFRDNQNEFLFFHGKTQKNQDYLLIFCNFFCNLEIWGDIIETSENEIKILNYQNDIARHAIIQTYSKVTQEFVLSDEYTVCLDEEPKTVCEDKLIPWAFCEAVNISNIKLARQYLSDELNILLSDEHIETFFGDFDEFKWNKYSLQENTICFLYGQHEKTCKKFLFEISQNKISNISCLD